MHQAVGSSSETQRDTAEDDTQSSTTEPTILPLSALDLSALAREMPMWHNLQMAVLSRSELRTLTLIPLV
jgi:hypothetical protein